MAEELSIGAEPKEESVCPSKIVLRKLVDKKTAQAVFHGGEKHVSDAFVLYFVKNCIKTPRYAVYMKKKYGIAVERNRAKRLVRAALFQIKQTMLGYDVILIPRRKMKMLGFWQIVGELQLVFCKADPLRHG